MIQLGTKEISNESNSSTQMQIYPRNRWLKNFNVQALKYLLVLRIQHRLRKISQVDQSMFGEILWSIIHFFQIATLRKMHSKNKPSGPPCL